MAQITINNPTVEVVNPSPIVQGNIELTGSGVVNIATENYINDGNVATTLKWSLTNVQNGTLTSFGSEMDSVKVENAMGTKVIQPGQKIKFHMKFNVPAGQPGATNPPCTADYTVQWL